MTSSIDQDQIQSDVCIDSLFTAVVAWNFQISICTPPVQLSRDGNLAARWLGGSLLAEISPKLDEKRDKYSLIFKLCRGIPGIQPSVCSISATWRSRWRRSRRNHLSTTNWWRCRSWRRRPAFWESWEKHSQNWRVSHAGTDFIFCEQAENKKTPRLVLRLTVYNALITHQGTDYLLVTHRQSVKHLISGRLLRMCIVLMDSLNIYSSPKMFCLITLKGFQRLWQVQLICLEGNTVSCLCYSAAFSCRSVPGPSE